MADCDRPICACSQCPERACRRGREVPPRLTFESAASNGYRLLGDMWHRKIHVALIRGLLGVEYLGSARLTHEGDVTATLSSRVQINMHFVPFRCEARGRARRHCDSKVRGKQEGVLVGRLRVQGEHGFTEVNVRRVKAIWRRGDGSRRARPARGARRSGQVRKIVVHIHRSTATERAMLIFVGYEVRPDRLISLSTVEEEEKVRTFRIRRTVTVVGGGRSFAVSAVSPRHLFIAPPSPFRGRLGIREDAGCQSIVGSLSAIMPGGHDVRIVPSRCSVSIRWPSRSSSDAGKLGPAR
jgi:hypothetical protein